MTLIVGIEHGGRAYMACDSGAWNGFEASLSTPKIAEVGPLLVGGSGHLRTLNVIRHHMDDLPPLEGDPERYVVREFVPRLRATAKEHGLMEPQDGRDCFPGWLLLACGGRLFQVDGGFSVAGSTRGYAAQGHDGAVGVALGVLHSTAHLTPAARLKLALEAAVEHTNAVRGPWHFDSQAEAAPSPLVVSLAA